jgi:protein kinase-like protein/PEGA domain-containing protein
MAIDDPVAFAPPPAFGPFRVLHQIGIGALGPVFRTYEPTRDRLVAVKVFRLDITPEQAQVLADELARASDAGLFHPSIVEPIASGVEGTVAYRAEEYVAAESLDAAIRHYAPAPVEKALPFLTQLAGAIDFARTAGIGHGALHLRDIFVTPEEARASGFGVVEALERVGLRAPVRRPYSAPERIAGDAWSTPADVFSLAAITYELLTGRRPSGTGDQMGPLTGEHLLEFGAAMRSVLARAMDEDPARRFPTGLAFASALEAAARGGRVTEAVRSVGAIASAPGPALPTPVAPATDREIAAAAALAASRKDDRPADLPLVGPDAGIADVKYADIASGRDEDGAEDELAEGRRYEPNRTLFDEESAEPEGHSATSAVAHPWEDDGPPLTGLSAARHDRNAGPYAYSAEADAETYHEDERAMAGEPERARPAVLPIAVTLILGLLIGFAAGYWAGGREPGNRVPVSAAATPRASAPADASPSSTGAASPVTASPSTGTPKPAGQAYSEQAVTPPSTAPPIPDEGPRSATPTENARPAAPAATHGRILVTSTPSRAAVTVNGRWRGRTPLTLDALRLGPYSLRIVLPGFGVERQDVTLSASEPVRNVAVRLQRSAPAPAAARRPASPTRSAEASPTRTGGGSLTGSIYVDSRPSGARILVDGRLAGTTPARVPEVTIGSHVVRLELTDHRPWSASTRVAAGEETRVTGSLERIP